MKNEESDRDEFNFFLDELKDSVHIIESPSREDIDMNRCEGSTLKESLLLAEVKVTYKEVKGKRGFI